MMIGKHNFDLSHIKGKQPGGFSQGCVCHMANLCPLQVIKCLPVDVDNFLWTCFTTLRNHSNVRNSYVNFKSLLEHSNLKFISTVKHGG